MKTTTWVKIHGKVRNVWHEAFWDYDLKAGFLRPYIIWDKRRRYLQVPIDPDEPLLAPGQ